MSDLPNPIRSGTMTRPFSARGGIIWRYRYPRWALHGASKWGLPVPARHRPGAGLQCFRIGVHKGIPAIPGIDHPACAQPLPRATQGGYRPVRPPWKYPARSKPEILATHRIKFKRSASISCSGGLGSYRSQFPKTMAMEGRPRPGRLIPGHRDDRARIESKPARRKPP